MRSKKYQRTKAKIEPKRPYSVEEAIDFIKENKMAKFDESVEIHLKLNLNIKKGELFKGTVVLPYGTGKKKRIVAFVSPTKIDEAKKAGADLVGGVELINQIKETKKIDFDLAIAEPAMMKDLSQIAKILGPRGLMPNPKTETITTDFKKTIEDFKRGKISFKSDESGNIHQVIGKISWSRDYLLKNLNVFLETIKKTRSSNNRFPALQKFILCSSMGPALKIKI